MPSIRCDEMVPVFKPPRGRVQKLCGKPATHFYQAPWRLTTWPGTPWYLAKCDRHAFKIPSDRSVEEITADEYAVIEVMES
jgi:hypothetical protein